MRTNSANKQSTALPVIQPGKPSPQARKPKSGRGRIRALVLLAVHLVILLHLAHYWSFGRTLSPAEPSESMYTLELGQLNTGAILFGLAIVSTAIFGRFFCGWGCHIVALQDLCSHVLRRFGLRPKPLRSRLLAIVPFLLAFYMFCWPTVQRLWRGDPHPGFSNHLMTETFWKTFPGPVVSILTFVVCGGLIVYLLGNKGFCTYACPYGAFFSISDRLAPGRIRVNNNCHQCGQCTASCTSNVQVAAEVRDFGMVVDPGCMKCMDCVSVCPNEALYFGFSEAPAAGDSGRSLNSPGPRKRKVYDFTVREELAGLVVAALAVYAFRGLYDVTPLLLSVALGVISAYLAVQLGRVFLKRDVRLQNFQLKRNNRTTKTGRWVLALLCAWFAIGLHSLFVQFHRYRGQASLNSVAVAWSDLLNGQAQPLLTEADHENIDRALASLRITDRFGIMKVRDVKLKLAAGNLMKSNLEVAEMYFRQAYACDPPAVRDVLREFLVSQERQAEAAEIQ